MASNPTNTLLEQIKNMSETDKAALRALLGAGGPAVAPKQYVKGGKFWTIVPRYVNDKYVVASPNAPALVTFPDHLRVEVDEKGEPVDKTLTKFKETAGPPVPPKSPNDIPPYHDPKRGQGGKKAAESGARPSDEDPA